MPALTVRRDMFKEVDHIAIVVGNTQAAQAFYRDCMGLLELESEVLEEAGVRLTQMDMGNVRLQLAEPLRADHPLWQHLDDHGEGCHHVCWRTGDVDEAMTGLAPYGLKAREGEPHAAPRGGRAFFIDPETTRGVLWEMTGR